MSADVRLYTSEDLRSRAVTDVVLPSRLRATVEALERVTKERDEARAELQALKDSDLRCVHGVQSCDPCLDGFSRRERAALAACAELRSELQAWACEAPPCANRCPASVLCERTQHALSSDAGRGWVSPQEHARVLAVVQEASMRIHSALIWGFDPNAAVGGLVRAVDALIEDRNARVSPEAFDAALREVARELCPYPASCANCDAIIAAAKARHGGGR